MRNILIRALLSSAIIICMGAVAQAKDAPLGQRVITAMPELTSEVKQIQAEVADAFQVDSGEVPLGAAPPLTAIWVYAVGSSKCGWESTVNQRETQCDHGGPQLRTAVLEIGYGRNPIVWMQGGALPNGALYARTSVCITNGYYTWPCKPGQTVAGWLNEYNLDGHQLGIFRYQNTSINAPWNTIAVQISIR